MRHIFGLILSLFPLAVSAQWGGDTPPILDYSYINSAIASDMLESSVRDGVTDGAAKGARRLPVSAVAPLVYHPDTTSAKAAETAYIGRLRKHNPAAADALAAQLHAHDFGHVFTNIVAPFGLRRGDIGDTETAYMLLGWMIATGSNDPAREQVAALRNRIAAGLAADPRMANPATRAALGEEIVISFVTLHAGWQSARREGKVQQYSDGVAAMFQKQTGNDLRQLVPTDRGLEKRG